MRTTETVKEELEKVQQRKKDLEEFIYKLMEELERLEQEEKGKEYIKDLWETITSVAEGIKDE